MKKNDIILILSILLISVLSMFAIRLINKDYDNKTAVIYIDKQKAFEFPLTNTTIEKRVSFKFGENIGYLDIKDGAVKLEEMDIKICPEKICSDTGWISKAYQTIVCLPNRIAVNIENSETKSGNDEAVDGVAF